MKLEQILNNHWYKSSNLLLSLVTLPFSGIFFTLSKIRYYSYKLHILKSYSVPVPVVIVGNITVGGVGKTPLTKHLAQELIACGVEVGIVLRGYRGESHTTKIVHANDASEIVGDEALIYATNNIPVAIGANRYLAALKLLERYPNIQLILADDGLQHYRLRRDYEIAVIDATRLLGNRYVLPMGPLRETSGRLKSVNAVVFSATDSKDHKWITDPVQDDKLRSKLPLPHLVVTQKLILDKIYNPITQEIASIEFLNAQKCVAMAAIGNPERFFSFIKNLGINLIQTLPFPDHYYYQNNDVPQNCAIILTTEKDYVKLRQFNDDRIWVVLTKVALDNMELLKQIKQLVS